MYDVQFCVCTYVSMYVRVYVQVYAKHTRRAQLIYANESILYSRGCVMSHVQRNIAVV